MDPSLSWTQGMVISGIVDGQPVYLTTLSPLVTSSIVSPVIKSS